MIYGIESRFVSVENGIIQYVNYSGERFFRNDEEFSDCVTECMRELCKFEPAQMVNLIINLTNDSENEMLAMMLYNRAVREKIIDPEYHSIDAARKLKNSVEKKTNESSENISRKTNGPSRFFCIDGWNSIDVKNGIVFEVRAGSAHAGAQCRRNDMNFQAILVQLLKGLAETDPKLFMEVYGTVKNDDVVFPLIEDIRKSKYANLIAIFSI